MNEDGTPLRTVRDSILDTTNVINIPKMMVNVSKIADNTEPKLEVEKFMKNMEIIAINSGKAQFINRNFLV